LTYVDFGFGRVEMLLVGVVSRTVIGWSISVETVHEGVAIDLIVVHGYFCENKMEQLGIVII